MPGGRSLGLVDGTDVQCVTPSDHDGERHADNPTAGPDRRSVLTTTPLLRSVARHDVRFLWGCRRQRPEESPPRQTETPVNQEFRVVGDTGIEPVTSAV